MYRDILVGVQFLEIEAAILRSRKQLNQNEKIETTYNQLNSTLFEIPKYQGD